MKTRNIITQPIPEQLRFPASNGLTIRADFNGGVLSTDLGPLILGGVDRQIQLTHQMAEAFNDPRHPCYIGHRLTDLMAQRVYQIACGYEDANDANALRKDPLFKMGVGRTPFEEDQDLASAATFSRLENAATSRDLYRLAQVFVDQFIGSYSKVPEVLFWTWTILKMKPMGNRSLPFTTITTAATATCLCFSLKASRENSSPRCFVPARGPKAMRTP